MASFSIQRVRVWLGVLAVAAVCRFPIHLAGQASTDQRVPVLVELFTSEGCSDCPPADDLLARLDASQPVPGAQAIVLSEHVTYWNRDGWTDPFSIDAMDLRQKDYVERFRLQDSYTPQAVVDGSAQTVGSSGAAVTKAVAEAAQKPKQPLTISDAHWTDGGAAFALHGSFDAKARLIAVLAADATHSEVARGENAGRTLHHVAVVRAMKEFGGDTADGRAMKLAGGPLDHKNEASGPVRLVVFAVDRKTGHVVAAAEQTLTR
ncbi:MAG TPA: DUF1223 domain-containing protein [Terracidiphilus sp.]|jgi:hypothetical protein|nr:DUF1223 domain-containing protein [Terracidiphilus sp.]